MKLKNSKAFLLVAFMLFAINLTAQQEEAPLRTFEYQISLNKLKTEGQSDQIKQEVASLSGVKNCELILIEYNLTFRCTNHDMTRYLVMDRVKTIILENGAEIVKTNRKEVK
jgi:hypothetical protein